MKRQLLGLFAAFCGLSLATEAQVVLNEINLVTGPNAGQFVELHGPANQSVDGHAWLLSNRRFRKAAGPPRFKTWSTSRPTLDEDGFLLVEGEGWQNTVAGVVLRPSSLRSLS